MLPKSCPEGRRPRRASHRGGAVFLGSTQSRSVALVIQPPGDFRDATVLRKFGDVPDDLSTL
jgi:hypothetical protein